MPVHLFGRPAPLAELAALGLPLIEDAAQAFGAAGVASTGVCSTFSFFPTKNLFALGDGGPRRLSRRRGGRARPDAALPRLARQADVRARRHQLAARRDPRRRAARLPAAPGRAGTRAVAWAPPRYAELGLGDVVEIPVDEPGHVYHMYVVRTQDRARISAALKEAGIASASYYVTPLHLQPAMRYLGYGPGSLPETERAAAENLALPMWGCIGADVQEQVVATVLARPGSRPHEITSLSRREVGWSPVSVSPIPRPRVRSPFNRHAVWQIAADAAIIALAWALAWLLRFDQGLPVYYDRYLDWQMILIVVAIQLTVFALSGFYNRWWRYVSTRDMWSALRGVCARLARHVPDLHAVRVPPCARAEGGLVHRPAPLPRVRGGLAPARPDADRTAAPGPGRGPRQGGDHRRGRRRRPARRQGDAAESRARLYADRHRRRRSAQAEPAPARDPGARHDGRPAAADSRPAAGRGADRDPVRVRRGAGQDRRGRTAGRAARQDPARADRARRRRLRPGDPAAARPGRGRARPGAGRGRSRRDRRLRLERGRDGHGRRRLDRRRALPAALPARPGAARDGRSFRAGAVRHRPRARPRAWVPRWRARRGGRQGRRQAAPGLRHLPARASSSTRPRTSTSR